MHNTHKHTMNTDDKKTAAAAKKEQERKELAQKQQAHFDRMLAEKNAKNSDMNTVDGGSRAKKNTRHRRKSVRKARRMNHNKSSGHKIRRPHS